MRQDSARQSAVQYKTGQGMRFVIQARTVRNKQQCNARQVQEMQCRTGQDTAGQAAMH